jgi:hypothetical protein
MLPTRNATSATKTGRICVAALGLLLWASAHITPAAGADAAELSPARAALYGYFREARGTSVPARRTAGFDEIRRASDALVHVSFHYQPLAELPHSAPVDASLSDVLARLHYAFGSEPRLSSDRERQAEREVLLRNSDAIVRAKVRLTVGRDWPGFLYADMGTADSALRWQGLAGISSGHGVDLLGGWRHVTYHFSPGRGFDSLEFNGPFIGVTRAW